MSRGCWGSQSECVRHKANDGSNHALLSCWSVIRALALTDIGSSASGDHIICTLALTNVWRRTGNNHVICAASLTDVRSDSRWSHDRRSDHVVCALALTNVWRCTGNNHVICTLALTNVWRRTGNNHIIGTTALTNVWRRTGNNDVVGTTALAWGQCGSELLTAAWDLKFPGIQVIRRSCAQKGSHGQVFFVHWFHWLCCLLRWG